MDTRRVDVSRVVAVGATDRHSAPIMTLAHGRIGASTLRTVESLAQVGVIAPERVTALRRVAERYCVAVTSDLVDLIDPDDVDDPVARQFVPHEHELASLPIEAADPIGDDAHTPVAGVVHRYADRALLKLTHTCAVYCRFCFRRERVGPDGEGTLSPAELERALAYIADRPEIWEVIVTGGDPLVLSPRRLAGLMHSLASIAHVKVVRFHTRLPVAAPARITDELAGSLRSPTQAVYVALHANHPRELTAQARRACARLIDHGLAMVSQTVLLRGVNDDPEVLSALMRAFVETRIKPYYLHHGDLAPGTSHLRTTIAEGQAVMRAMRGGLSGLCQPTYVLDIPGGHGKVPIGPSYLSEDDEERRYAEDPAGRRHRYPPPE